MTAVTSVVLMGGALYAALEGRVQLTQPAQGMRSAGEGPGTEVVKGARPSRALAVDASSSDLLMVSTVSREGNRDVVKVRPFLLAETALALAPGQKFDYPPFNPLTVFSEGAPSGQASAELDQIYGAQVDSEVTLEEFDFDTSDARVATRSAQRDSEIEELVRNAAPSLTGGATSVAAIAYFDPGRFSSSEAMLVPPAGVTITAENVSDLTPVRPTDYPGVRFGERVIRVRANAPVSTILKAEEIDAAEADKLQKALSSNLGGTELRVEDRLRIAYESRPGDGDARTDIARRISIYRGGTHLVSVSRTPDGRFVYATAPEPIPQIAAGPVPPALLPASRMPRMYDAVYQAALGEKLDLDLATKLIRIFAFDVDYEARINPADALTVLVSLEEGDERPSASSDILFASLRLGQTEKRYYRFRDPGTGLADYFDETGKSAKQFLLRQPVPNGSFRSPFGSRVHPILRYRKMHWGVDWSAPRGTPILAAGNGTVISAGWESGYGKQTQIRHANGYVTSYSHQSNIAKGIKPGAKVRLGQLIGYVGTTGLSTGPHLHYEVIVNGAKVDPMRIKLPKGTTLKGRELEAFQLERARIDALVSRQGDADEPPAQF